MEAFFKKYFWTLVLAFLAVSAFLVAKTANVFIGAHFRQLPGLTATGSGTPTAVIRRGSKSAKTVISRNIFNSEAKAAPEPTTVPATTAQPEPETDGPGVESDLNVTLVAVILTDHPQWSFAQIREHRRQDAELFKIGDMIKGEAKIVAIEWRRVIILRNGRREVLTMFAPRPRPRSTYRPPIRRGGPRRVSVNSRNIKRTGRDRYVIARDEIDKQLNNLNYLATQARIVPHFERGRGAGFKLFAIRPGSIYSKIGIRNGDVVKQINGEVIDSPDKALGAYARLKSANQIVIDIVRNGVKRTLTYNISD